MTSNTTPSGVVSASGEHSSPYSALHTFDGSETAWISNSSVNSWVQYQLPEARIAKRITILNNKVGNYYGVNSFKVQASNDGATFTELYSGTCLGNDTVQEFSFANNTAYSYYRLHIVNGYGNTENAVREIQLYTA